jgi:hypothetical protein
MNDDHDDDDGHGDDLSAQAWKRRKKKRMAQGKGILIGAFCFATQDTKRV